MNLDNVVKPEHWPWEPNDDVSELDVWAADDVPTLGLFSMPSGRILFMNILGVDTDVAHWAYVPLKPAEALDAAGREFETPEAMWQFAESFFDGREVAMANSEDLRLDRLWSPTESSGGPIKTCIAYLNALTKTYQDQIDELTVGIERIDAEAVKAVFEQKDETEQQLKDAKALASATQ
jgi:hypothetical protein